MRLSGTIVRECNGAPLEGVQVIAEEMASGERHCGQSDRRGDFRIEELPRDRMYEVKLGKKGMIPRFLTLFLSGDRDLGTIALTSWGFAAHSDLPSESNGSLLRTFGRPFSDSARSRGGRLASP